MVTFRNIGLIEVSNVLARLGYASRGIMFILLGLTGLGTALSGGSNAEGPTTLFFRISAAHPVGQVLLIGIALGFLAFALWRFIQAFFNPEDLIEDGLRGIMVRAGFLISTGLHIALAHSAALVVLELHVGSPKENLEDWISFFFNWPYGKWLIIATGAGMIGAGFFQLWETFQAGFDDIVSFRHLKNKYLRWLVLSIGILGRTTLQLILLVIGFFLIKAAWSYDPSKAADFAKALSAMGRQTHGSWLLGILFSGLFLYGCFLFLLIVFRRYPKP